VAEADIDLIPHQKIDLESKSHDLTELEPDPGMASLVGADRFWEQAAADRRDETHHDLADLAARRTVDVPSRSSRRLHERARVDQQDTSGLGELHAATCAVEEASTKITLESNDLAAEGGLCDVKMLSGAREAERFSDGEELP